MSGDAFDWVRTFSDYSASDGWSAKVVFRNDDGAKIEVDGSGAATVWTFTLNTGASGEFTPGNWTWTALVFLREDRRRVEYGRVLVEPDPERVLPVSWARQNLDRVEAVISGRVSKDQAERWTIGGQSIDKIPANELFEIRDRLRAEVRAEENRDRRRRGLRSRRVTGVKFT